MAFIQTQQRGALQNNNKQSFSTCSNERTKKIETLQTKQDWLNYQESLKGKMFPSISKFERSTLNAKITGTLERENFTVEKILFESHPGFYVTVAMFLPKKRQNPAPCVIYCSGHTELGFRSEVYQRVIINLVEKGFIVFAFDPIGQGERLQYIDEQTGKSKMGGSTTEHSYAGVQTLLTGTSLSDYFVWDGVRALDYLETRKEVDMKRIGITGPFGRWNTSGNDSCLRRTHLCMPRRNVISPISNACCNRLARRMPNKIHIVLSKMDSIILISFISGRQNLR